MSLFARGKIPSKFFLVESLDLAHQLLQAPVEGEWFRLAEDRRASGTSDSTLVRHVMRKCFLIEPKRIERAFRSLSSIGNAIGDLGHPVSGTIEGPTQPSSAYYHPAHHFDLHHSGIIVEPLVSERIGEFSTRFLVNPDIWLFLGLEEMHVGSGIWIDPRNRREVLRQRDDMTDSQVVEIRTEALNEYLRARQRALIVGHYADVQLRDPSESDRTSFEACRIEIEARKPHRAKALLFQNEMPSLSRGRQNALIQQLHLWFCLRPQILDLTNPFQSNPGFATEAFTLPTSAGDVAPERFKSSATQHPQFAGVHCDFLSRVFFRQEVLEHYQRSAQFEVSDNGGITCGSFWELYRSTSLYGNEYISTAIGDFAEGVPYEEWPHWKQHAILPPGRQSLEAAASEPNLPQAVNDVVNWLRLLNTTFVLACAEYGVPLTELWVDDADSFAARRLKRIYRGDANDDEFLERVTAMATLVLDGIQDEPLRAFLMTIGSNLHQSFEKIPTPLCSRKLLERVALTVAIDVAVLPDRLQLPLLVRQAEMDDDSVDATLSSELRRIRTYVHATFAPFAHLYDLRNKGGVAHRGSASSVSEVVARMGLPSKNWRRADFVRLLREVSTTVKVVMQLIRYGIAPGSG